MILVLILMLPSSILTCAPLTSSGFRNVPSLPVLTTTTTTEAPMPEMKDYDVPIPNEPVIPQLDIGYGPVLRKVPADLPTPAAPKPPVMVLRRDTAPLPVEKHSSRLFPSLFDLFRPLALPTLPPMKNIFALKQLKPLGSEYFKDVPRAPSPFLSHPSFLLQCSPPISWTYCEPMCGSGDQAVDQESAIDNAMHDIKEALDDAFTKSHLGKPRGSDITLQYAPSSVMLDEFGPYFDTSGYRYTINGNAVAFKAHKNDTQALVPFIVKVTVNVRYDMSISSLAARQVASQLYQYLALHKGARFSKEVTVNKLDNLN